MIQVFVGRLFQKFALAYKWVMEHKLITIAVIVLIALALYLNGKLDPYLPKDYWKSAWDCGITKGIENC